jgi:predicted nucleotidyltransferase
MILTPDFREFIALLNAHEVRYLVVGGYAVGLHGHPRYTKDIDIWIERTPLNAEHLMEALAEFGFKDVGLTTDDFLAPDRVVQLGRPPNRIDLLTSLSGVSFPTCYKNKAVETIEGTNVQYIGLADLKQNKRALGRHQDLADIEHLGGETES